MRTKHAALLPYDEKWKQDFIAIKSELSAALGDTALAIPPRKAHQESCPELCRSRCRAGS